MILLRIIKSEFFWLFLVIVLGLAVRLYKYDSAVADWHAWRQADTAAVSRIFYQEGFNPLYPKYFDMSDVSGLGFNLKRLRFVEFPLYNSLVYFVYVIFGEAHVKYARLTSIAFSLGSIFFLFLITRRFWGTVAALLSALTLAILPFSVYFSRVVLPEPALIFFSLGMFYFVDRWSQENKLWLYVASIVFTASAFLLKPFAIFYTIPLFYLILIREKNLFSFIKKSAVWIIPSLIPFIAWRLWISQYPQGVPQSSWLFNGNGIRFKPAFWRWIVGDRFGREILSGAGMILFALGLLQKPQNRESVAMHLLAAASFLYLIVVATGNVQHDYYQALITPAVAAFTARGFALMLSGFPGFLPRIFTIPLAFFLFGLTLYLTSLEVLGLYQINNNHIVIAGEEADRILPKDAVVIAPYNGDTSFLYYVNRYGFPLLPLPEEEMIKRFGVTHYVSVNFDEDTNRIMRKYQVLEKDPRFVIVDLRVKNM